MTPPVLTAFYAGLLALIYLWLTARVIRKRRGDLISHGDGDDAAFAKVIRGQANAAEQMPIIIIMLALAEMLGAPTLALHVLGVMIVVGRLLHGLHFNGMGPFIYRPIGMALTLLVLAILALGLVAHGATQAF
ncbi:MAG: MAPEG family protein [Pikeienuella sp.]